MKLSERSAILDADLTDDCLVHIVKPGTPNASYKGTVAQIKQKINFTSGGWEQTIFNLTQAQVRTLKSANGGFGYKLFDAPGANKTIDIRSVVCLFDKTSGTEVSVQNLELYEANYTMRFQYVNLNWGFIGKTAVSMKRYVDGAGEPLFYFGNKAYYLYTPTADLADYDGTMQVIVEHRTLNLVI